MAWYGVIDTYKYIPTLLLHTTADNTNVQWLTSFYTCINMKQMANILDSAAKYVLLRGFSWPMGVNNNKLKYPYVYLNPLWFSNIL